MSCCCVCDCCFNLSSIAKYSRKSLCWVTHSQCVFLRFLGIAMDGGPKTQAWIFLRLFTSYLTFVGVGRVHMKVGICYIISESFRHQAHIQWLWQNKMSYLSIKAERLDVHPSSSALFGNQQDTHPIHSHTHTLWTIKVLNLLKHIRFWSKKKKENLDESHTDTERSYKPGFEPGLDITTAIHYGRLDVIISVFTRIKNITCDKVSYISYMLNVWKGFFLG